MQLFHWFGALLVDQPQPGRSESSFQLLYCTEMPLKEHRLGIRQLSSERRFMYLTRWSALVTHNAERLVTVLSGSKVRLDLRYQWFLKVERISLAHAEAENATRIVMVSGVSNFTLIWKTLNQRDPIMKVKVFGLLRWFERQNRTI